LKKYGILTVVDSVAAMGGEELQVDKWQIDIALGGSQKVISAPPGLTIASISTEAYQLVTLHHPLPQPNQQRLEFHIFLR
ncbi:aminotransferase class V-fold PLP-dependent enzyme, partial [Lactococcus lactis]